MQLYREKEKNNKCKRLEVRIEEKYYLMIRFVPGWE